MTFNFKNYKKIQEIIEKKRKKTKIIAISKFHSKNDVLEAVNFGVRCFGENRLQEAMEKFQDLKEAYPDINLHFTGNLQSNKIKEALSLFDSFHTIYKEKQLKEFSKFPEIIIKKNFFIQVNTGLEETKGGLPPKDVEEFLNISKKKYNVNIDGLMCIPPINENPTDHFLMLKDLKDKLGLKELSMGMTNDYQQAIACDSNYVRIGTLLFGKRS